MRAGRHQITGQPAGRAAGMGRSELHVLGLGAVPAGMAQRGGDQAGADGEQQQSAQDDHFSTPVVIRTP